MGRHVLFWLVLGCLGEREFGRVCGFHHLLVCNLDGDGVRGGFEVWEVGLGGEVVAGGTGVYDGLGYGGA